MTTYDKRPSAALIPLRPAISSDSVGKPDITLETFSFVGHPVRVLTIGSDPWFIAKEIAEILGYSDAEAMTRRLDDDEKQNRQIVGFGPRGVATINESGLYSAVMGSNKPEAKGFRKWVTGTVLPAIRKTGSYVRGEEALDPNAPDYLERLKDLLIAAQERKLEAAEAQLALQAPKVAAQERLAASAGSMSLSDAARCLGMKDRKFFAWLQDNGWIFRSRDSAMRPVPYADKRSAGWMEVASSTQQTSRGEIATQSARITAKGLAKLAEIHGVPGW
ncbi:phage antirepressor [Paracoccus fontiphilus]|uniref:Phage antirepressor n=1 Tax=Paracoccus fontiphilus TaxID=1815556 RepID=A0ABV7I8U7_9RHOB|nr:phage antirepressor KilAC domain-containing protein [Paracoccus fontiphilus]